MTRLLDRLEPRHALAGSLALTFLVMRGWLHASPDTDLNVGPYNIHHLFTGVLILTACGVPAVLRGVGGRTGLLRVAGFGAGLSLVLDEWLYLIVTDGSNAAYVRLPSLLGGASLVTAASLYALWWSPENLRGTGGAATSGLGRMKPDVHAVSDERAR
jgi:hypothetical protein